MGFLKESKCFLLYLVFFFCYWFQVVIHTVANLHPSSDPFLGTSASSSEAPRFGTLQASSWDLNIVQECLSSMPSPILKEKEEKNPPRICGEGKKPKSRSKEQQSHCAEREKTSFTMLFSFTPVKRQRARGPLICFARLWFCSLARGFLLEVVRWASRKAGLRHWRRVVGKVVIPRSWYRRAI